MLLGAGNPRKKDLLPSKRTSFYFATICLGKKNEASKENEAILEKASAEYAHIYNRNITDDEFIKSYKIHQKRKNYTKRTPMKISRKFFKWFLPNAEKIITIGVSILILIGLIFLIFIVIDILQAFQKGMGLELLISGVVLIFLIYSLYSDTLISRIFYLFISVLAGVILVSYENKIFSFLFSGLNKKISEEYFITLLLGITTLFTLWVFRTKDIKEQIKNQKKILANQDFFDAMRMLTDDKLVSQEIAVLRLIDISKKTKVYDDTIKLAFIKRMKAPYKENELRNYAQYILGWFKKRYTVEGLDLKNLDLSYQDFTATDTELNVLQYGKNLVSNFVIQKMLSADNLDEAVISRIDLSGVDLKGTNLKGADLRKVILEKADLRETNLSKVDLTGANLTGVDLTGANLTGVDLTGVDLTGVDLTEIDLTEVDLTGVDLTGKDLTEANLTGAKLKGADLRGADLTGAKLKGAKLKGADLRGADLTRAVFCRKWHDRNKIVGFALH